MRACPGKVGVERLEHPLERVRPVVGRAAPDPVELTKPLGRLRRIGAVAGDGHDPLAARARVAELGVAVLGGERVLADHEHEAVGRVDVVVDVLLPLRRGRDVLPVDPDVLPLAGQEGVQLAHERPVRARVGDEHVRHDVSPREPRVPRLRPDDRTNGKAGQQAPGLLADPGVAEQAIDLVVFGLRLGVGSRRSRPCSPWPSARANFAAPELHQRRAPRHQIGDSRAESAASTSHTRRSTRSGSSIPDSSSL